MAYKCEICKFSNNIKSHYERHLLTAKHMTNAKLTFVSQKLGEISQNDKKVSHELGTPFACKYCKQAYKHKSSLSKHIKYSCTQNKDEDLKELVRLLNNQNIDKLQGQLVLVFR